MERIDDLQFLGLRLIQDDALPCFSMDAVALCNYLSATPGDRVADLGSGNGILSILGQGKTGASFAGVERQAALCALARRSAALNGQDIPFHCVDVRDAPKLLGHGTFSKAVCNPPYFTAGEPSPDPARAAARHAEDGTLSDFLHAAFLLLKNGGTLFLSYPADGLCEAFCALRAARLEPKRLRLVAAMPEKAPRLALIAAKKGAKPGLMTEPIQILSNES